MANYSKTSNRRLNECHKDLITIFTYVIKHFDNTILYGHRTPKEQYQLWLKGREDDEDIVTYCDGYQKLSEHNESPSHAVDAVPWFSEKPHIRWKDKETLYYFSGYVLAVADMLYDQGKITHRLRCGADWSKDHDVNDENFFDLVHFELIT